MSNLLSMSKVCLFRIRTPNLVWHINFLSNEYLWLFSWDESGRGVKLATYLHPVPTLRMRRAVSPLIIRPCPGALSVRDNVPVPLYRSAASSSETEPSIGNYALVGVLQLVWRSPVPARNGLPAVQLAGSVWDIPAHHKDVRAHIRKYKWCSLEVAH
jgi:hypothetical protein